MKKGKSRKGTKPGHSDEKFLEFKENCIYVCGFEEGTTEDELKEAFPGNIVNVSILKAKKSVLCLTLFINVALTEDLVRVFATSKTKALADHRSDQPFAFIKFDCSEDVEGALSIIQPKVKGTSVFVEKTKRDRDDNDCVLRPEALKQLLECSNVSDQMHLIQTEVQCSPEERTTHEGIRAALESVIQDFFPDSSVNVIHCLPYGIRGWVCNFNINLALENDQPPDVLENYPKRELPDLEGLIGFEIKDGLITWESLKTAADVNKVFYIQRILNKHCSDMLSEVHEVGRKTKGMRTTGLKAIHLESGTRVSIIINSRDLEIRHSLLKCYSELDPRVAPLIYTLEYWNENQVSKKHHSSVLTKVNVFALLTAYLSSLQPPIIPTVEKLSELTENKDIIHGHDYSIETDLSIVRQNHDSSLNKMTVEELFVGFFEFCTRLDFERRQEILDVRNGKWIQKENFLKMYPENKKINALKVAVLDPFIRTGTLSMLTFGSSRVFTPDNIIMKFFTMFTKLSNEHFKCEHPTANGEWGLTFLFNEETDLHKDIILTSEILRYYVPLLRSSNFSFPVYLPEDIAKDTELPPGFIDRWYDEVQKFLIKCVTEIFMFKMTKLNNPQLKKDCEGLELMPKVNALENQIPWLGKRKFTDKNLPGETDVKKLKPSDEEQMKPLESVDTENVNIKQECSESTEKSMDTGNVTIKQECSESTEKPGEDLYFEPESVMSVHKCAVHIRTWNNRKLFKKNLGDSFLEPTTDEFTKEAEITRLMTMQQLPAESPFIQTYVTFIKVPDKHCLELHMHPTLGLKEFTTFFLFFVSVITKVVAKSFSMEL